MGKGKSWGKNKGRQLSLSWKSVSQDPIKGTGIPEGHRRSESALKTRWSLIIRLVSKFSSCYKTICDLNESGKTDDDKFDDALKLFLKNEREEFEFEQCWSVLKNLPKFNPFTGSSAKKRLPAKVSVRKQFRNSRRLIFKNHIL
jgi:hypothetical protein